VTSPSYVWRRHWCWLPAWDGARWRWLGWVDRMPVPFGHVVRPLAPGAAGDRPATPEERGRDAPRLVAALREYGGYP
jgi:hypothetical protein